MTTRSNERILDHYRQEAMAHELRPTSTMADETTRELEVASILAWLDDLAPGHEGGRLLEIGCGNGYLLSLIRDRYPALDLSGIDLSPEMIGLANDRRLDRCALGVGDVRSIGFPDEHFDVLVSERCVINVLDAEEQEAAVREAWRVLRPQGHLILIEAFTDAADTLNRTREEIGLPTIPMTHHNLWLDKSRFLRSIESSFEIVNPDRHAATDGRPARNFLSSHFFVSRVLYPAVTRREVMYNTEFVRFFRSLPPEGDFAPIQLFVLRRLDPRSP